MTTRRCKTSDDISGLEQNGNNKKENKQINTKTNKITKPRPHQKSEQKDRKLTKRCKITTNYPRPKTTQGQYWGGASWTYRGTAGSSSCWRGRRCTRCRRAGWARLRCPAAAAPSGEEGRPPAGPRPAARCSSDWTRSWRRGSLIGRGWSC